MRDASVDDSQPLDDLLEEEKDQNQDFHADSTYTIEEQDQVLAKNRMNNKVHEKQTLDRRTESIRQGKIKSQGKGGTHLRLYGTKHERVVFTFGWYGQNPNDDQADQSHLQPVPLRTSHKAQPDKC